MQRISTRVLFVVAPVALAVAAPALAGPVDPPYKGGPDSVHLAFDWDTFNMPWTVSESSTGATTYPLSDQGPDSIESDPDATFICPNLIDDLPIKYMRLQLFFDGPIDVGLLDVGVVGHDPQGAQAVETGRGEVAGVSPHAYYIDFEIRPNPDWEEIFFHGNQTANIVPGNFLRLEVDTVTIPAPTAGLPLAFGALALTRRRRR